LPLCAAWEACSRPPPPQRRRNPFADSSQPSLNPLRVLINKKKPFHSVKEEKPHDGRLILLSRPPL
jgi:hypothetical protein